MYRVLMEDLGKKPYKMMKRYELTVYHERIRAEKSRYILYEIAQGPLSNLMFIDEKKIDIYSNSIEDRILTRRQNAVCHRLGSCDSYRKISVCFCAV
ncbi:hypothetical protein FHG87_005172 [Trinorchestia longiramus]|nr:hypothetical protein FHG87_005172 [Trinorchestia longiramus]